MEVFGGLDVSLDERHICVVDEGGRIIKETRALLTARTVLVEKVTATENSLRAALRNFGLKMGSVTRNTWVARARELADGNPVLEGIVDAMARGCAPCSSERRRRPGSRPAQPGCRYLGRADPSTMAIHDRYRWANHQGWRSSGSRHAHRGCRQRLRARKGNVALEGLGAAIAKRTSMKNAIGAVSRKLATILLAMRKSGTAYWAAGRPPASARDVVAA